MLYLLAIQNKVKKQYWQVKLSAYSKLAAYVRDFPLKTIGGATAAKMQNPM
jgi:hypothetical protein